MRAQSLGYRCVIIRVFSAGLVLDISAFHLRRSIGCLHWSIAYGGPDQSIYHSPSGLVEFISSELGSWHRDSSNADNNVGPRSGQPSVLITPGNQSCFQSRIARLDVPARSIFSSPAVFKWQALLDTLLLFEICYLCLHWRFLLIFEHVILQYECV